MANVIRIKRSTGSSAPVSLANAELAFSEGSDTLFLGKGTGGVGGSATTIEAIAGKGAFVALSGQQTVSGDKTFSGAVDVTGTLKLDGTAVTASAVEINALSGVTAGTASPSKVLIVDANKDLSLNGGDLSVADISASGNVTIGGNLTVNGTTTTINSTTISVDDKTIELGATASPTDASANGGGIVLKGTTDKSILYSSSKGTWDFSESVDLPAGGILAIGGNEVLSDSTLASSVIYSSLEEVGVITSGSWNADLIDVEFGGTGSSTAQDAINNLTQVHLATTGQVLSKNGSGNAVWTEAPLGDRLSAIRDASAPPAFAGGLTDRVPYFTNQMGSSADFMKVTEFARSLLDDADAASAQATLELVVGTDVQEYSDNLSALAGLTSAANKGVYFTGSGAASTYDLSAFGRTVAGLADAAALKSELSLVVGTDVQAYDAELAAIAGLTSAADKGIYFTGSGTASTYDLSSFGRSLVDDADAAAARTTLGLGSIATQAASNVSISGGTIDNVVLDGGSF